MPSVPFNVSVPANDKLDVPLAPFDRFGGNGGDVTVKATSIAAESGDVNLTLIIGSDVVQSEAPVFGENVAGQGPTSETIGVSGFGAPADPITIRLANTTAGAIVISGHALINNS